MRSTSGVLRITSLQYQNWKCWSNRVYVSYRAEGATLQGEAKEAGRKGLAHAPGAVAATLSGKAKSSEFAILERAILKSN